MLATTCPSCGAELNFRSPVSVSAVCASCGSLVTRTDVAVEAIGVMASLPDDISPVQVGATLVLDGRTYTILGRARMAWEDGAWSEWFIDDGTSPGWLIEAQGFFSAAFKAPVPPELAAAPWPALHETLSIKGKNWVVSDLKTAACVGSEGELPFLAPRGRQTRYADLTSEDGGFAGLEESEDGRRFFTGVNLRFDDLHFDNLRPVDGWTMPRLRTGYDGDPEYPLAS